MTEVVSSLTNSDVIFPMDVVFLGYPERNTEGKYLDNGFDYRDPKTVCFPQNDLELPFIDEKGRPIIRLGSDVSLPFRIYCFGRDLIFTHVGQQHENKYELRQQNSRFLIYRID